MNCISLQNYSLLFIPQIHFYISAGFQPPLSITHAVQPKTVFNQSVWFSLCLLSFSKDLLTEARKRLAEIAKDAARYSTLLEGLVLQVKPIISLYGQGVTVDWFVNLLCAFNQAC